LLGFYSPTPLAATFFFFPVSFFTAASGRAAPPQWPTAPCSFPSAPSLPWLSSSRARPSLHFSSRCFPLRAVLSVVFNLQQPAAPIPSSPNGRRPAQGRKPTLQRPHVQELFPLVAELPPTAGLPSPLGSFLQGRAPSLQQPSTPTAMAPFPSDAPLQLAPLCPWPTPPSGEQQLVHLCPLPTSAPSPARSPLCAEAFFPALSSSLAERSAVEAHLPTPFPPYLLQ